MAGIDLRRAPTLVIKRPTQILSGAGGSSGSLTAGNELCSRYKTTLPVTPTRYRLKIRNYSVASLANGGPVTLTAASVSNAPVFPTSAGNNRWAGTISGTPVSLTIPTTAIDGLNDFITSAWQTNAGEIAERLPFVVSVGIINNNGSSSTVYKDFEGGFAWIGAGASTTTTSVTPSGALATSPYIDVQVEYEYATAVDPSGNPVVPTVLAVGDSITQGLTGDTVLNTSPALEVTQDETWLGQAGLAQGFAPINLGIALKKASDFVTNWAAYTSSRVDLATSVPDAAVISLGINDIVNGASAATLEGNLVTLIGSLRTLGVKRIYLATMIPGGWTVTSLTPTGTPTSASPIVTGVSSTQGVLPGMAITGTGVPASTSILTVDSPSQLTMTANATSSPGSETLTIGKPGSAYVTTSAVETIRQTVNEWQSRMPLGIDGVWDFDKAVAQQAMPSMADPQFISVYPHPDIRGYTKMAGIVRL